MSFFFSFLPSLVFLQLEREYIIGYREKQSYSLLIFFRWIPLENIFLFLRADGIYVIFSSGLKVWLLLPLSKILSAFFTRSLGMGLVSSHDDLIFKTDFSYFLFRLTEEGGYFRFEILANHLASIFFLVV